MEDFASKHIQGETERKSKSWDMRHLHQGDKKAELDIFNQSVDDETELLTENLIRKPSRDCGGDSRLNRGISWNKLNTSGYDSNSNLSTTGNNRRMLLFRSRSEIFSTQKTGKVDKAQTGFSSLSHQDSIRRLEQKYSMEKANDKRRQEENNERVGLSRSKIDIHTSNENSSTTSCNRRMLLSRSRSEVFSTRNIGKENSTASGLIPSSRQASFRRFVQKISKEKAKDKSSQAETSLENEDMGRSSRNKINIYESNANPSNAGSNRRIMLFRSRSELCSTGKTGNEHKKETERISSSRQASFQSFAQKNVDDKATDKLDQAGTESEREKEGSESDACDGSNKMEKTRNKKAGKCFQAEHNHSNTKSKSDTSYEDTALHKNLNNISQGMKASQHLITSSEHIVPSKRMGLLRSVSCRIVSLNCRLEKQRSLQRMDDSSDLCTGSKRPGLNRCSSDSRNSQVHRLASEKFLKRNELSFSSSHSKKYLPLATEEATPSTGKATLEASEILVDHKKKAKRSPKENKSRKKYERDFNPNERDCDVDADRSCDAEKRIHNPNRHPQHHRHHHNHHHHCHQTQREKPILYSSSGESVTLATSECDDTVLEGSSNQNMTNKDNEHMNRPSVQRSSSSHTDSNNKKELTYKEGCMLLSNSDHCRGSATTTNKKKDILHSSCHTRHRSSPGEGRIKRQSSHRSSSSNESGKIKSKPRDETKSLKLSHSEHCHGGTTTATTKRKDHLQSSSHSSYGSFSGEGRPKRRSVHRSSSANNSGNCKTQLEDESKTLRLGNSDHCHGNVSTAKTKRKDSLHSSSHSSSRSSSSDGCTSSRSQSTRDMTHHSRNCSSKNVLSRRIEDIDRQSEPLSQDNNLLIEAAKIKHQSPFEKSVATAARA